VHIKTHRALALGIALAALAVVIASALRLSGEHDVGHPVVAPSKVPTGVAPGRDMTAAKDRAKDRVSRKMKKAIPEPDNRQTLGLGSLRGMVSWSSDSRPVEGAIIIIAPGLKGTEGLKRQRTDALGRYLFKGLKRMPYRMAMVFKTQTGDHMSLRRQVDLTNAGAEERFTVPCCEIRGVVVDRQGNVSPGVGVLVSFDSGEGSYSLPMLTTDQTGSFKVPHLMIKQDTIMLDVRTAWSPVVKRKVAPNESLQLRFVVRRQQPQAVVNGVVVAANGRRVKGARVYKLTIHKDDATLPASKKGNIRRVNVALHPVLTDVDGKFSVSGVHRGSEVDLVVVAAGHGGIARRVRIPAKGQLASIRMQLRRGDSTLRGTVVDGSGKIVPRAWVIGHDQSYGITGVRFLVKTNSRGEYVLPLISGREYMIEVDRDGYDSPERRQKIRIAPRGNTLPPLQLRRKK